jgi:hypothetical protein
MSGVWGPIVGGLLAIAGGLLVVFATDRREHYRWRRDAQLRASVRLLTSLQALIRPMIDVAYLPDKHIDSVRSAALEAFHESTINWNGAMYEALLVSTPPVANLIQGLDQEVDRLLNLAMAKQWSRADFRSERIPIGRLAAGYLRLARRKSGLAPIDLDSVWAWSGQPPPDGRAAKE